MELRKRESNSYKMVRECLKIRALLSMRPIDALRRLWMPTVRQFAAVTVSDLKNGLYTMRTGLLLRWGLHGSLTINFATALKGTPLLIIFLHIGLFKKNFGEYQDMYLASCLTKPCTLRREPSKELETQQHNFKHA